MVELISRKKSSWLLVASAFAILLLFIMLAGLETLRHTTQIGADIARIQQSQEDSGRILNDLRSQTYTVAIELRDYLQAPPAESALDRERLLEIRKSMNENSRRLDTEFAAQIGGAGPRFRQALDRYWHSMDPIFDWTPKQKQELGAVLLRSHVAPNRTALLETTDEIEALRSMSFQHEHDELIRAQQTFRNSVLAALLVLISFGLIVAVITSLRLRTVEGRAQKLQLQTERDREDLRGLSNQLVNAQEDERRSISRELHDQIGQMLTAIQMQFSKIEVAGDAALERKDHLKDGKVLVDRTVRAVRDMAMGLRPSILDDLGLIPALEWQAREFTQRSGIQVNLNLDDSLRDLPDGHRTCLYRVVQEALTNCGRHAQARQVSIALENGHGVIWLRIQDDGTGFEPTQLAKRGLGLIGMDERVRKLGGNVEIISQTGSGTALNVEIPYGAGGRA